MKADNLTSYLQNPALLHDVSYQELKSMVVQYPYCQNLRYLLVTKSHLDDMQEYESDLHLASTYSIDRNFLFKHLHQEAYTQSSTESLVLEKEPIVDIPEVVVPIIAAAPIAKEVLDLNVEDNIVERRTIRIQSENAKLFAEQKAGLPDENAPRENFIDKIAEVEESLESSNIPNESIEETVVDDVSDEINELFEEGESPNEEIEDAEPVTDRSKLITYLEKPDPKKSRSVIDQLMKRKVITQDDSIEELFEEENLEDELESLPTSPDEIGETPSGLVNQAIDKEVIFEITNDLQSEVVEVEEETDNFLEEETNDFLEEINVDAEDLDGDEAPTDDQEENSEELRPVPIPKDSYKDWKEKFLPDTFEEPAAEVSIEEILRDEEAYALDAVIDEEISEEKKKKGKKKKKKKNKNKKQEEKPSKKSKKKKKKKQKILEIAKESIRKNDDIISETLAELLVQQGSRKKAIQMYERLSLIFPEKNSFFAEKIEQLKN